MFNKLIAGLLPYLPQRFVWIFSKRYVAGLTIEDAIAACKKLNAEGVKVTIDILGEFIKTLDEAETNTKDYIEIIETTQQHGIDGNYSVKPTMFGMLIDQDACYKYVREIVAKAASYNNFIRIDMEDSPCTGMEIALFRKLQKEFPKNVGLVMQAYLKRTKSDIESMLDMNSPEAPVNYRLCKGIYIEPAEVAYKEHQEIVEHYLEDLEYIFQNKIYVGIATHDKPVVERALELIRKYNVPENMYEFQMLYGVTPELRKSIVDAGHAIRVYVPYGKQWFTYCTRRLKENPKMAGMVMKALFKRG